MKFFLVSILSVLSITILIAQDCEVKIPEIAENYEGKCKKGLAHGEGIASGVDTYEGSFKKGLPHGEGVYTFANGNVYSGSFEKGQKVGKGMMKFSSGDLPDLDGYWIDDEYAGKDKKVYKVIDQSTSIRNMKFRRVGKTPNQITYKFTFQGKPIKVKDLVFDCPNAIMVNENEFQSVFSVSDFPISGNVRFQAASVKDVDGSPEYIYGQAEFQLSFKGDWEIQVEMNVKN